MDKRSFNPGEGRLLSCFLSDDEYPEVNIRPIRWIIGRFTPVIVPAGDEFLSWDDTPSSKERRVFNINRPVIERTEDKPSILGISPQLLAVAQKPR